MARFATVVCTLLGLAMPGAVLAQPPAALASGKALLVQKKSNDKKKYKPVRHDAEKRPASLTRLVPKGIDDLRAIEKRIEQLVKKCSPAVVSVQVGNSQGSAVIISPDGYVLTAGHVSGGADRAATFKFPNGRQVKGKTLGANVDVDSGLMKITDRGPWPYLELGNSDDLKNGEWCFGLGHPRGFQNGRPPVLRTGRVISNTEKWIRTDVTLFSGDSGGPLLNIDGRVIGIHSRISGPTTVNLHVPVDSYHNSWDRLADGDVWPVAGGPLLGINGENHEKGCRVTMVFPGTPAEVVGIKKGDIITTFNGKKFVGIAGLSSLIRKQTAGDGVIVKVLRDGKPLEFTVKLGKRN